MSLFHKLAFYPTVIYGVVLEYCGLRKWYTRIDEHCILGALPMQRNYKDIVQKENVKAVLTMNQDHELLYSISKAEWSSLGVEYLQVEVEDYIGVASLEQIEKSINFINKHKNLNQCVYVHCKAGRYRSALIVACYLINSKQMKPEEAIERLKNLRPNVILEKERQITALNKYYNHLYSASSSE